MRPKLCICEDIFQDQTQIQVQGGFCRRIQNIAISLAECHTKRRRADQPIRVAHNCERCIHCISRLPRFYFIKFAISSKPQTCSVNRCYFSQSLVTTAATGIKTAHTPALSPRRGGRSRTALVFWKMTSRSLVQGFKARMIWGNPFPPIGWERRGNNLPARN